MSGLAVDVLSPRCCPLDPVFDLSDPGVNSPPADNLGIPMHDNVRNLRNGSDTNLPFSLRKRGPPESPLHESFPTSAAQIL